MYTNFRPGNPLFNAYPLPLYKPVYTHHFVQQLLTNWKKGAKDMQVGGRGSGGVGRRTTVAGGTCGSPAQPGTQVLPLRTCVWQHTSKRQGAACVGKETPLRGSYMCCELRSTLHLPHLVPYLPYTFVKPHKVTLLHPHSPFQLPPRRAT